MQLVIVITRKVLRHGYLSGMSITTLGHHIIRFFSDAFAVLPKSLVSIKKP